LLPLAQLLGGDTLLLISDVLGHVGQSPNPDYSRSRVSQMNKGNARFEHSSR
jgi:hypothetical protein